MHRRLYTITTLAVPLTLAFLATPTGLDSCAIAPPAPVFATKRGPGNLHGDFLNGRLGVIRTSFRKTDLITAFRILSGKPLRDNEIAALYPPPVPPGTSWFNAFDTGESMAWRKLRESLAGPSTAPPIDPFKTGNGFFSYRNCLDDAFITAGKTLSDRAVRWGLESDNLKQWAQAQDTVFLNCNSKTPTIPSPPTAGMDPLLAADRNYQMAAAHFYAGNWKEALSGFDQIAHAPNSPWHKIAPYLAARTLLRQGQFENPRALDEAVRRFAAIAADSEHPYNTASAGLLAFGQSRRDPVAHMRRLSQALLTPAGQDQKQALDDFLYIYSQPLPADGSDPWRELAAASELTDWLLTLDGRTVSGDPTYAIQRWRERRTPAWLIAALIQTYTPSAIPELANAARKTSPSAPEYESVTYYGIARQAHAGDRDAARTWATEALRQKLTLSGRNLILSERLKLARNFAEFLRDAPRRPEPRIAAYDNSEIDVDEPPVSTRTAPLFDEDAAALLNRRVPLRLWLEAASSNSLAPHLQLQLAQSGWYRAVLLGRQKEARAFLENIVRMQPTAQKTASEILNAKDQQAAHFASVLLMMRAPHLHPLITPGGLSIGDLSNLRDNNVSTYWGFSQGCLWNSPSTPDPHDAFLSAAERREATEEWSKLQSAASSGATYFPQQVLAYAQAHPDDPRVPLALHLAVRGTRIGCKDKATGPASRAAFQFLHKRYPNNPWTAQTKYWYE